MSTPHESASFIAAKPIWPSGRERELNLFVGFRAVVERTALEMHVAS